MKTRSLALFAGLLIPLWPQNFICAQTPEGTFVKAPVSVNFKEALSFPEISLMVRGGMAQAEVVQEVHQRGLVRPITAEEAKVLRDKGAGPALIAALQDRQFVLTPADYDNYLERQAKKRSELESRLSPHLSPPRRPAFNVGAPPPAPSANPFEIELPMDEFTAINVNGHILRVYIHDNGDDTISLKVENQRPTKFPKAQGFDSRNDNLTPLIGVDNFKVSFVNTPRAHMNKCILRVEPK